MTVKLGQNFLHDKNIAAKIINEFLPQTGPVLEIGAGPGILSGLLLEKMPTGPITLVEVDSFLAQRLRERFGDRLRVMENNILDIDLAGLFPVGQVAVIGNLPYHISKELIDWFIAQRAKISLAVLMLQKDFVDKLLAAADRKKYNAQSVVFQLRFRARRCFNVSPGSFLPQPRVMSTVLAVRPDEFPLEDNTDKFYDFVKLSFAERRKTLWNNLAPHYERALLPSVFKAAGVSPQARAEQLPPGTFVDLFAALLSGPVTAARQKTRCD
jgi:16S rRNA (adenine1518-N6/adenine1519-N6)-dimethyltransferase